MHYSLIQAFRICPAFNHRPPVPIRIIIGDMKAFKRAWLHFPIAKKTRSFTMLVIFVIALAITLSLIINGTSLASLGGMVRAASACTMAQEAMGKEVEALTNYVRQPRNGSREELARAIGETEKAINSLPSDYEELGPERYGRTWRVLNTYGEYAKHRDQIVTLTEREDGDIQLFYKVSEMQGHLSGYLQDLTQITVAEDSEDYQQRQAFFGMIPLILAALAAAVIVFTWASARLFSESLVTPIQTLAGAVREISKNDFLGDDVVVDNEDELGELVDSFNQMKNSMARHLATLEENRVLTEKIHSQELQRIEAEKKLDTARLDLLRSQMDPHFLFNTLNTIAGMAELEEAETTEKMIRSLSSIFRYNLQTTAQFAALSREMKVVRDYMYLQQMRFGDRIRYEEEIARDVDPDRITVPALIIQPLVENAVIHGLSHSLEGGKVCIFISRTEENDAGFIVIRIEDTGEGMDEETLLKVRAEIEAGGRPVRMGTTAQGKLPERAGAGTPEEHSSDEIPGENGSEPKEKSVEAEHAAGAESENELRKERRVGIGLGNVAWRIRDVYKDGNMTIESRKGEGTVVTLFIPEVNDG